MKRIFAAAVLSASSVGCLGISHRPEVQTAIAQISEENLRMHIQALCAIGPRPAADQAAVDRTVEYIEGELRTMGLQPYREEYSVSQGITLSASYRSEEKGETQKKEIGTYLTFPDARGLNEAKSKWFSSSDQILGWSVTPKVFDPPLKAINVFVEIHGVSTKPIVLELGAHYDTEPFTPGADDNASGIAVLLESARILSRSRLENTVRLCFFTMEEDGLTGSRLHVEKLLADKDNRTEGILVLDMVGYATDEPNSQDSPVRIPLLLEVPRQGNFIIVAGNIASGGIGNIFEGSIDTYLPSLPYYSANRMAGFFKDSSRSDHYHYWENGMKGILLSDTAEMRNPHYHRPGDTPETLNYDFLTKIAAAVVATMMEWAGLADLS